MADTRTDYNAATVTAARSVLLELSHLLGEYRDAVAVVGGWVPELLLPGDPIPHVGTIDVDLALNHRTITEAGYRSIAETLIRHGYRQGRQPFIFLRDVPIGTRTIAVEVDLLAGEYEGTGKSHRTQRIQDVLARKARGCDLAFDDPVTLTITGVLPGGGKDSTTIRVASVVTFLVMKGMALHDRLKSKDAWDIYFCLTNYPGGPNALALLFSPYLNHQLVREGLAKIRDKFSSTEDVGPHFVADFGMLADPDERARVQRDAYERVRFLMGRLGIA